MKNLLINAIGVLLLLVTFTSCKKDPNNSKKEGNITISVNYKPSQNSSFVHSWGQTEVKLHDKNGVLVATQYANPNNPNLDFGKYQYGDYRVDCNTNMISTNVNTGSSSTKNISRSESFTLDEKNKSVSVTMSY
ncbi:hypothetical protein [Fluviicola sp.]|uniref:hypothetical protein n=1 Tax=Fluviicola sp. TaxID=1917219 RepID=UPI0026055262|nr:hypothetical protein [Fluviicola sp.]